MRIIIYFYLLFNLNTSLTECELHDLFKKRRPKIYVIYEGSYNNPIRVQTDYEGANTLRSEVPLITKDSYPGLSLIWNMPFKMKDKKYQMIDNEGKYIGDPYKWVLIIDYDFYWVGNDENNGYINTGTGYIINKAGVKLTEEGIEVEEFNVCWGFIFITKLLCLHS